MNTTPDRTDTRALYLTLLKQTLKNLPYLENEWNPVQPRGQMRKLVLDAFRRFGIQLCHARRSTVSERMGGLDHTSIAHTMVSMARLESLQTCVEDIIVHNVPGDLIETGVLRGGCSILMRAILKAYGVTDRSVWLADSFAGLPPPDPEKYPADASSNWHLFLGGDVGVEEVRRNFDRYGLLDDQVRFLKGWFRDTLPTAPIEQLALIRLDGDLYESTMDGLVNLYPKLSVGGYLIIDDYNLEMCREAVHDYRGKNGIREEIVDIDGAGAYWKRAVAAIEPALPEQEHVVV